MNFIDRMAHDAFRVRCDLGEVQEILCALAKPQPSTERVKLAKTGLDYLTRDREKLESLRDEIAGSGP
jgi:hypothetical protein